MSRSKDPRSPLFTFGNPFKMIQRKGSILSPRLLALMNSFEEDLKERFSKLKPKSKEDVLSFSWMSLGMELLCQTHSDIKTFITELELPVCDWDDTWIGVYLDNSVKLLDICIVLGSELSRLNQGNLLLQCALHNLKDHPTKPFIKASSSLDRWGLHISSKNPRLVNCFSHLDLLVETLNPPKIKNSTKGKVLMWAMYGVKVFTIFFCSIFAAGLSGSANKLVDLHAPVSCLWAESFADVQSYVNGEMRNIFSCGRFNLLKEIAAVHTSVKKLTLMSEDGADSLDAEVLESYISDLGKKADELSSGLDLLTKQVNGFFQIVMSGRDALLSDLRVGGDVSNPTWMSKNQGQVVS